MRDGSEKIALKVIKKKQQGNILDLSKIDRAQSQEEWGYSLLFRFFLFRIIRFEYADRIYNLTMQNVNELLMLNTMWSVRME